MKGLFHNEKKEAHRVFTNFNPTVHNVTCDMHVMNENRTIAYHKLSDVLIFNTQ